MVSDKLYADGSSDGGVVGDVVMRSLDTQQNRDSFTSLSFNSTSTCLRNYNLLKDIAMRSLVDSRPTLILDLKSSHNSVFNHIDDGSREILRPAIHPSQSLVVSEHIQDPLRSELQTNSVYRRRHPLPRHRGDIKVSWPRSLRSSTRLDSTYHRI